MMDPVQTLSSTSAVSVVRRTLKCMSTEVAAVLETAKTLTREQRADLAHELLLTLDELGTAGQIEIDAGWRTEIGRRLDEILSGKVDLVSGEESRARARALLSELHE